MMNTINQLVLMSLFRVLPRSPQANFAKAASSA